MEPGKVSHGKRRPPPALTIDLQESVLSIPYRIDWLGAGVIGHVPIMFASWRFGKGERRMVFGKIAAKPATIRQNNKVTLGEIPWGDSMSRDEYTPDLRHRAMEAAFSVKPAPRETPTPSHQYLDRFTIVKNCVIVDGWATKCDPSVYYDGVKLDAVWKRIDRPDLEPLFGEGARAWGFTLCAILPTEYVDQTRFSMHFNSGNIVDNPCAHFCAPTDQEFQAMWNDFVGLANESGGRLLEVGSRDRSGNSYRSQFPGIGEWVGLDVTDGPGVDVIGDAHCLSRQVTGKFDFAFSMAVFEHLLMPWKVAIELNRVLKPGGRALIISHAGWPLHEEPWDFWRFSKESWRGLFNEHTGFRVIDAQYEFPARIVPDYVQSGDMVHMSHATTYLLSGCVVERTGDARVEWAADAAEVYDLGYSYA